MFGQVGDSTITGVSFILSGGFRTKFCTKEHTKLPNPGLMIQACISQLSGAGSSTCCFGLPMLQGISKHVWGFRGIRFRALRAFRILFFWAVGLGFRLFWA